MTTEDVHIDRGSFDKTDIYCVKKKNARVQWARAQEILFSKALARRQRAQAIMQPKYHGLRTSFARAEEQVMDWFDEAVESTADVWARELMRDVNRESFYKQFFISWEARPMNTDKPSMKKERRPSVSITDLVAQMAGQQAHEQVQKLEDEVNTHFTNIRQHMNRLDERLNAMRGPDNDLRGPRIDKDMHARLNNLENDLRSMRIKAIKDADLKRVENSMQRKGFAWPPAEDKQLEDELQTAFEAIAANHGRSIHGIRCRIRDKKLLDG